MVTFEIRESCGVDRVGVVSRRSETGPTNFPLWKGKIPTVQSWESEPAIEVELPVSRWGKGFRSYVFPVGEISTVPAPEKKFFKICVDI